MKAIKLICGVIFLLIGLLLFVGHSAKNRDGSPITVYQKAQDSFAAGLFVLIGAALLISARKEETQ